MSIRTAQTVHPTFPGLPHTREWARRAGLIRQLIAEPTAMTVLLVLVGMDMVLIGAHLLISGGQYLGMIDERAMNTLSLFSITSDRSVPEYFNNVKEMLMLGTMVLIWMRSRAMIYMSWSIVLLLILGDDTLRIHENIGHWVSAYWFGSSASDGRAVVEMAVWAGYALLTVCLLWHGHRHSTDEERDNSWAFLFGILAVSFFAVGVDALHSLIVAIGTSGLGRLANALLHVAEDGGEMVMLSLTCAIILGVYRRCRSGGAVQPAA